MPRGCGGVPTVLSTNILVRTDAHLVASPLACDNSWAQSHRLHLTALRYQYWNLGALFAVEVDMLDLAHDFQAIPYDSAKHNVLAIKVRRGSARYEELAAILIAARVGHAEQARASVPRREVLVGEVALVYAHHTRAVPLHGQPRALADDMAAARGFHGGRACIYR